MISKFIRDALGAVAREIERLPPSADTRRKKGAALASRGLRHVNLITQDVRGWPVRQARARTLKNDLHTRMPWDASQHKDLLLSGHLARATSSNQPRVSVIIPVYGKLEFTLQCLASLGACNEATPFEVIVVDDGSADGSQEVLSRCPGIRYERNSENVGFIESCNRGAASARGSYLHFLNNDTVVLPGWLDALVQTFEGVPAAGLVGSRLIYPNMRLQESGGVVWRDGSATNWGNGRDPFNPTYNYLRDVDYCSAASVLVDAELFRALHGFDTLYKPAYYEDTDLAFRIRAAGRRVLVQPASSVIHHEGATSGTDVRVGPKQHQVTNQVKFRTRWSEVLLTHGDSGDTSANELDRRSVRSVLVLGWITPKPDQDSGSIDVVNILRIFKNLGYRVTFLPVVVIPRGIPAPNVQMHEGAYTEALERMGVECPTFPYETSVERFVWERGAEFDLVYFLKGRTADRFLSTVKKHCPRAKTVLHTVDLHYLREEREALHTGLMWMKWKAVDTKRRELRAARLTDMTLVMSTVEVEALRETEVTSRVRIVPLVRELPPRGAPCAGRQGALFVGGFRHRPNLDAVRFLVGEIWPLVRPRLGGVRLHLVGSAMPPEVLAMATKDIIVHGHVPDLSDLYNTCRVSVAPLRYGAGLKGKVAGSLAHGVPCVATSVAVEGSALQHDREVLVGDSAADFAAQIVRVHQDDALWERLALHGRHFVEETYSVQTVERTFRALLGELGLQQ